MREYAFFTNFPTPQKVDMFNHLNERLGGRVIFFFYAPSVPKRKGWEDSLKGALFRYEFLNAFRLKTSIGFGADEAYAFLPTTFPDLSPFRRIVVSGGLTPSELLLGLKALASGVPYILWTGAPSILFGGWWGIPYRLPIRFLLFSNAEVVVAATTLAAGHSKSLGAKRVVVAHTAFNTDRFRYHKVHRGRCPSLLFVGRLIRRKRLDDLVRSMATVEGLTLDVMGDGEMREALEKLVRRLGMEDRVRFLGHVPYERMPSLYRRYDVLVLPARWEVFGFVVVEALMSSTAAIVSSEVGAKDFLPREAIFPVGDIPSLSDRLRAFRDPDLRNRVVRYAQRRVEELATPERWASTFAALLEE